MTQLYTSLVIRATYLVEGASFPVQLLQTCFADCVSTAEADRPTLPIELKQADGTGEELGPLWSLDRHGGFCLSHDRRGGQVISSSS